jgi:hypothetical protein
MFRLRLPQLFNDSDELNVHGKTDDDQAMGNGERKMKNNIGKLGKAINADINWSAYATKFESVPRENLTNALVNTLFQVNTSLNQNNLKNYVDESGRQNFIRTATIQLMSTPEYQMC